MIALQKAALAFVLALVLLSGGCGEQDSQTSKAAPGISNELQQMWPIWKPEDLELNKRSGNAVQYKHELNLRPKYYKGKMPLVYTSSRPLSGMMMGMGGPDIIYVHAFDDFSNYFIYDAMLLKGIVAVDKSKTMVAEARLEWKNDLSSGFYRPTMEEFHYSGGMLVFNCKSKIDYDSGTKTSEFNQSGSKRKDYFFILPFGINAH
jgi:hypothetical protein